MCARFAVPLLMCASFCLASAEAQTIRYVDDDASTNGDGAAWGTAYRYLQDALYEASTNGAITEIRVGQGTYKPDQDEGGQVTPGDRDESFELLNGVELKGGYAGMGAPDPDARDVDAYETILSGDLAGDDGPDFANNGENSHHVVLGIVDWGEMVVLDGFTITGGNATEVGYGMGGAGMRAHPPTELQGGEVTLIDCTFRENWAASHGGGLYGVLLDFTLSRCTFLDNYAGETGGGARVGCHACESTILTADNCAFRGNSAGTDGGAIELDFTTAKHTNCTFSDNHAVDDGGAVMIFECWPTYRNCVFTGNTAGGRGGAAYSFWEAAPTFIGCTFHGNSADIEGGAICDNGGWPEFKNCILWGDSPEEIVSSPEDTIVTYSDIDGGWPGDGNIDTDPMFVDADGPDDIVGTEDDNLRLEADSPCINAGDPDFVPEPGETDLDGHARVLRGRVDMGAYEYREDLPIPAVSQWGLITMGVLVLAAGMAVWRTRRGTPNTA